MMIYNTLQNKKNRQTIDTYIDTLYSVMCVYIIACQLLMIESEIVRCWRCIAWKTPLFPLGHRQK